MSSMQFQYRFIAAATVAVTAATAALCYIYFWDSSSSRKPKNSMNNDNHSPKCEVNIDNIDRNVTKKRVSYCRCWKSKKMPFCDGAHKAHNKENDDHTGPLVLVWNEPDNQEQSQQQQAGDEAALNVQQPELPALDTSIISEKDIDIKSFGSDSPLLDNADMSHFDAMLKPGDSSNGSAVSDDHSIEMIEDAEVNQMDAAEHSAADASKSSADGNEHV